MKSVGSRCPWGGSASAPRKAFGVTPGSACIFFRGGEDRQAVSAPQALSGWGSLFWGGCGGHRDSRGGGPRVTCPGGGLGCRARCVVWAQRGDSEIFVVPAAGGRWSPCGSRSQRPVWSAAPRLATEKSTPRPFRGVGQGPLSWCRLWHSHVERLIRRAGC